MYDICDEKYGALDSLDSLDVGVGGRSAILNPYTQ